MNVDISSLGSCFVDEVSGFFEVLIQIRCHNIIIIQMDSALERNRRDWSEVANGDHMCDFVIFKPLLLVQNVGAALNEGITEDV